MSDYEVVAKGALKLKGVSIGGVRKKKKKLKRQSDMTLTARILEEEELERGGGLSSASALDGVIQQQRTAMRESPSGHDMECSDLASERHRAEESGEAAGGTRVRIRKTAAQLAFEKMQEKRQMQKILEKASKTHKQRVEEFNRHLDSLTEHYDIPKVSWTK